MDKDKILVCSDSGRLTKQMLIILKELERLDVQELKSFNRKNKRHPVSWPEPRQSRKRK